LPSINSGPTALVTCNGRPGARVLLWIGWASYRITSSRFISFRNAYWFFSAITVSSVPGTLTCGARNSVPGFLKNTVSNGYRFFASSETDVTVGFACPISCR